MLTTEDFTYTLTWTPPFTLDISNVDPDIGYCVDVANSTTLLLSQCEITSTEFTYTTNITADCAAFWFTVTPVNIVGNGTSQTRAYFGTQMREYYLCAPPSLQSRHY